MQIALIVIVLPVTNISNLPKSKKSRAGPGEEYRYKVSIWANAHVSLTLLHNSQLICRSTLPPPPPPPCSTISKWQGKFLDRKRFSH